MADSILYSFRRCPYAMRARMAIIALGIRCELREVVLRDKPAEMLAASAKGTVPVLITPEGIIIDESLDIMYWALRQNDPEHWLSQDESAANALIHHNDTDFKKNLDRYKYPNRYPDEDCSDARDKGLETLNYYEVRLSQSAYLLSDRPSLADIAVFPFIRQFAHVDRGWFYALPLPELHKFLAHFLKSDLFSVAMKNHRKWVDDSPKTYIN